MVYPAKQKGKGKGVVFLVSFQSYSSFQFNLDVSNEKRTYFFFEPKDFFSFIVRIRVKVLNYLLPTRYWETLLVSSVGLDPVIYRDMLKLTEFNLKFTLKSPLA